MIASAAVTAPKAAHSNAIEQDQKTPLFFFSVIKSLAGSLDETTPRKSASQNFTYTHTKPKSRNTQIVAETKPVPKHNSDTPNTAHN